MRNEDYIFLVAAVVAYIATNGSASTQDLRRYTHFRFDSREISWVLKRLRAAHIISYLGVSARRWILVGEEVLMAPLRA